MIKTAQLKGYKHIGLLTWSPSIDNLRNPPQCDAWAEAGDETFNRD